MKRCFIFLQFLFLPLVVFCQADSTSTDGVVIKQGVAGTLFTVPEGKQWEFISLTVSEGTYPILVGSVKYDSILNPGDSIRLPFWVAEAELLSGNNINNSFMLKVKESTYQE